MSLISLFSREDRNLYEIIKAIEEELKNTNETLEFERNENQIFTDEFRKTKWEQMMEENKHLTKKNAELQYENDELQKLVNAKKKEFKEEENDFLFKEKNDRIVALEFKDQCLTKRNRQLEQQVKMLENNEINTQNVLKEIKRKHELLKIKHECLEQTTIPKSEVQKRCDKTTNDYILNNNKNLSENKALKKTIGDLKASISLRDQKLKATTNNLNKIAKEKEHLESKIKIVELSKNKLFEKYDILKNQFQESEYKFSKILNENVVLKKENKRMKLKTDDLEKLRKENEELISNKESYLRMVEGYRDRNRIITEELRLQSIQLHEKTEEFENMNLKRTVYICQGNSMNEMQLLLKKREEEYKKLLEFVDSIKLPDIAEINLDEHPSGQVSRLTGKNVIIVQKIKFEKLKKTLDKVEKELTEKEIDCESIRKAMTDTREELAVEKSKVHDTKKELSILENVEYKELRREMENLKIAYNKATKNIEELKKNETLLKDQLNEQKGKIHETEIELKKKSSVFRDYGVLRKKHAILSKQHGTTEATAEKLDAKVKHLEKELQNVMDERNTTVAKCQKENTYLRDKSNLDVSNYNKINMKLIETRDQIVINNRNFAKYKIDKDLEIRDVKYNSKRLENKKVTDLELLLTEQEIRRKQAEFDESLARTTAINLAKSGIPRISRVPDL